MVLLTGYLGRDRQIRETRLSVSSASPLPGSNSTSVTQRRNGRKDSLVTEQRRPARVRHPGSRLLARRTADQTSWYRVVVWNPVCCRMELAQGRPGQDHRAQELPYS